MMQMKYARSVVPLFTGLMLVGVAPASAQSTAVDTCGQQLSAPGNYHLTGDLSSSTDGVVITASDVSFTLAGYTISGVSSRDSCDVDQPQLGVRVEPGTSNVRVSGGTVTGFVDGVMLYGSNSRVSAMTITNNCVFGITVSSDGNVVDTNAISGSGWDGIALAAASHATTRPTATSAPASRSRPAVRPTLSPAIPPVAVASATRRTPTPARTRGRAISSVRVASERALPCQASARLERDGLKAVPYKSFNRHTKARKHENPTVLFRGFVVSWFRGFVSVRSVRHVLVCTVAERVEQNRQQRVHAGEHRTRRREAFAESVGDEAVEDLRAAGDYVD